MRRLCPQIRRTEYYLIRLIIRTLNFALSVTQNRNYCSIYDILKKVIDLLIAKMLINQCIILH